MAERYTPTPARMSNVVRNALEQAASGNAEIRVLLNHIYWLETEGRTSHSRSRHATCRIGSCIEGQAMTAEERAAYLAAAERLEAIAVAAPNQTARGTSRAVKEVTDTLPAGIVRTALYQFLGDWVDYHYTADAAVGAWMIRAAARQLRADAGAPCSTS